MANDKHFIEFITKIEKIELPKKFTFPFYYVPNKLAKIASKELQEKLLIAKNWNHDFGLTSENGIGKMFGVLVVKNKKNKIGYLTAYSGKLLGQNNFVNFVPPVFDIYSKNGFFQKEEQLITLISKKINELKKNANYINKLNIYNAFLKEKELVLKQEKIKLKLRKGERKKNKIKNKLTKNLRKQLEQESLNDKFYFRELLIYWEAKIENKKEGFKKTDNLIIKLKKERIKRSKNLHQYIFDQYYFLDKNKSKKSLNSIFKEINKKPIAGTGNCAAPKLLQYAFQENYKPIALAEFWFGKPLENEVRKHLNFYPACNGKCKPILNYMLNGIELDKNKLIINLAKDKKIKIIYQDNDLIAINKPAELLSVKGKNIKDSVQYRIKKKYPEALIVHRLDMSTSGIMLIAKSKLAHKKLQKQFIDRTIKKQYVAILNGIVKNKNGTIDLPLITDYNDTPKQKVCFLNGRKSVTKYKVIAIKNNKTLINFYPITGRTHQLRVHAAHYLGLGMSILGDDLYGEINSRLYLHANKIEFIHPNTKIKMIIECKLPF